jgi:hypothetical protein
MADDDNLLEELEDDVIDAAEEAAVGVPRSRDISKRAGIRKDLLRTFREVEEGYRDQWNRSNEQQDFWDIYNCVLTSKQFYVGNSKIFVPVVHNAINARKTRFTNQIFPQAGRYVEVTSSDGTRPDALASLLEYYVRKAKLRTKVMPALTKAGDVEGQYNVYVSWCKRRRHVTWRAPVQPELMEGIDNPAALPIIDIRHEEIEAAHPEVEVIADADILILPTTADSIDEALEEGGSVTIIRRWGKAKIQQMMDDGAIRKDEGEELIDKLAKKGPPEVVNQAKTLSDAAGIKGEGKKHALVYETFCKLEIKGERLLCQAFYGGEQSILGARRNPLWSDKVPLLSCPVEKVGGLFKGRSKIADCADLQYAANDAINEAWDSAGYSLLPIVMTDPAQNPRTGSMIMSMAAVWETSPQHTQVVNFPQLWKDGFALVEHCKQEVSQTLSVSPAAITQGAAGTKAGARPNQAMIAQEQQIDILNTADSVTVIEEGVLTPMLDLFVELDHQHRDEDVTVRAFGEMGLRAGMEKIPPVQMDRHYQFRWFGVEQARSAQQVQQQIAAMNVVRGIPPQQLNGYQVNLVPVITQLMENTFGPRLSPLVFVSPEAQLPVPVGQENMLLAEGFEVPVHPQDDDQQHIQAHMQLLQAMQQGEGPKNTKKIQTHIFKHVQQGQAKQQAAMQQQMGAQAGTPGIPGGQMGGAPQPGVAGTPRIGAQPGTPRPQGPPGQIPQDQLQDPRVFPRRVG